MTKHLKLCVLAFLALPPTGSAQFQGWQHSGPLCILTTPEGADLAATAAEEGFPLLVRLDKAWFPFSQAKPNGYDLRFAAEGKPLAYQIDAWDPADGRAAICVRIPTIKGNARQELKLFWGKSDANSESNGKAVFNEANGYVSVWHMDEQARDEVGTVEAKDTGTTSCSGMVGMGRHFEAGQGIDCGTKVTTVFYRQKVGSQDTSLRQERHRRVDLLRGAHRSLNPRSAMMQHQIVR